MKTASRTPPRVGRYMIHSHFKKFSRDHREAKTTTITHGTTKPNAETAAISIRPYCQREVVTMRGAGIGRRSVSGTGEWHAGHSRDPRGVSVPHSPHRRQSLMSPG